MSFISNFKSYPRNLINSFWAYTEKTVLHSEHDLLPARFFMLWGQEFFFPCNWSGFLATPIFNFLALGGSLSLTGCGILVKYVSKFRNRWLRRWLIDRLPNFFIFFLKVHSHKLKSKISEFLAQSLILNSNLKYAKKANFKF